MWRRWASGRGVPDARKAVNISRTSAGTSQHLHAHLPSLRLCPTTPPAPPTLHSWSTMLTLPLAFQLPPTKNLAWEAHTICCSLLLWAGRGRMPLRAWLTLGRRDESCRGQQMSSASPHSGTSRGKGLPHQPHPQQQSLSNAPAQCTGSLLPAPSCQPQGWAEVSTFHACASRRGPGVGLTRPHL